jgi:hypothetical protein
MESSAPFHFEAQLATSQRPFHQPTSLEAGARTNGLPGTVSNHAKKKPPEGGFN